MHGLERIELQYESLIPVDIPSKTFLSVGTITLTSDYELNLDFNETHTSWHQRKDHIIDLETTLADFEPRTFEDEYLKLGLKPSDLVYEYFANMMDKSYVTEVYTEYVSRDSNRYLPLTLKGIQLFFSNGKSLDYSDRISIFALADLAKVA